MPGFLNPPPPPPHATRADTTQISNAPNVNVAASFLPDFLAMMAVRASTKSNPSHRTKTGALGLLGQNIGKTEDGAVVEIVSVEVVDPEPGVTLGGEKEQDASDGDPEQASVTGLANAPNCRPTEIV